MVANRTFLQGFLSVDPHRVLGRLTIPILVLHGGRDEQIPATEALIVRQALQDGVGSDYTIKILKTLSHHFAAGPGSKPGEDYLAYLKEWLATHEFLGL